MFVCLMMINATFYNISVVIGTDYIGSCESNYYTITATTAPP
jgi:hypothetical protein